MAGQIYGSMPGWWFAFIMMAVLNLMIGLLVFLFVVDPRRTLDSDDADDYFKRVTFVGKGNAIPFSIWSDFWSAMIAEMKDSIKKSSAALNNLFAAGCATGSLLGGLIADRISRLYPDTGRIMCAQFSAFMSIPFSLILLFAIPQSVDYWFVLTLFFMGLTISWCAGCANNPIFAEVVSLKH